MSNILDILNDLSNSEIKSFIYYSENTDTTLEMIDKILQMNNYKIMCLFDSKENQINKNGVINNKCNSKTLSNINLFVSNKRTIANSPIIILNNLSLESINLIKSDYVLKRPKSYNLSVIVIGSPITDIFEN
jgi:ABC-type multidrug transport system ATPase subunit